MREILHLTPAAARRQPWKNGRGQTEELAIWPAGASFERGDFDWRIALAAIDLAGPFSAFPGFERVLVVMRGAGLRLDHGAAAPIATVPRLQPHRFSGEWPTTATLIDGPVSDFNVLVRRGAAHGSIRVLRADARPLQEPPHAGHTFIHVVTGTLAARVGRDAPVAVAPRESLWIRGADREELQLATPGEAVELIIVRLEDGLRRDRGDPPPGASDSH